MSLVILGAHPLPEMQGWAHSLFQGVPSGDGPHITYPTAGLPFQVCRLIPLQAGQGWQSGLGTCAWQRSLSSRGQVWLGLLLQACKGLGCDA